MGLNYSELEGASIACPGCTFRVDTIWQFYFGTVGGGTIRTYRLGDTLEWGNGRDIGSPGLPLVYATAYSKSQPTCQNCRKNFLAQVVIRNDRLQELQFLTWECYLKEEYYEGAERIPRP